MMVTQMVKFCFHEIRLNLSSLAITFTLFLLYIITIPLLIGFSQELLYHFHLAIIWICILFAFLPERFLQSDFEDGTLELYFLSNSHLQPILISKLLSYWCVKIGGIVCTFPLLQLLYHFEPSHLISITLVLGSLAFALICAIHSCLTLGLKSNTWNNIHHLTTLPTLMPLIMLCTYAQSESRSVIVLIGYLGLLFWIYLVFVSTTLQKVLSN